MAKDPRRFVSFTLPEDQSSWIEDRFGGADANKVEAIKTLIGEAMVAKAQDETPPKEQPVTMSGLPEKLDEISATLDLLTQKYMADHPQKEVTRAFTVAMEKRWQAFKVERSTWIAKAKPNAV